MYNTYDLPAHSCGDKPGGVVSQEQEIHRNLLSEIIYMMYTYAYVRYSNTNINKHKQAQNKYKLTTLHKQIQSTASINHLQCCLPLT